MNPPDKDTKLFEDLESLESIISHHIYHPQTIEDELDDGDPSVLSPPSLKEIIKSFYTVIRYQEYSQEIYIEDVKMLK